MLATFFYKAITMTLFAIGAISPAEKVEDSAVIAFGINGGELLTDLDVVSQKAANSYEIRPPYEDSEYRIVTVSVNDQNRVCKLLALSDIHSSHPAGNATLRKHAHLVSAIEDHYLSPVQYYNTISPTSSLKGADDWVESIETRQRRFWATWRPAYSRMPHAIDNIRAEAAASDGHSYIALWFYFAGSLEDESC